MTSSPLWMALRRSCYSRGFAALLGGVLCAAGYAPLDAWPLPLFSLGLLFALLQGRSWRQGALLGGLFGIGLFATGISWVHVSINNFGGLPLVASLALMALLVLYLALFPALVGTITALARIHQPLAFGGSWLLSEWLRGWLFTGFPWLELGASQLDAPWAGFLAWGGASGLGLLMALSAAAAVRAWYNPRYALVPAICGVLTILLANISLLKPRPEQVPVALVQGNVQQILRWDPEARDQILATYRRLQQQTTGARLVVWPEAAVPVAESGALAYLAGIDYLARSQQSALITGIVDYKAASQQFYNNLIVLGGGDTPPYFYGHANRYSKHHLLPIGEFVPLGDLLRPLAPLFNLPMSDFSRGAYVQRNLQAAGLNVLPALCYEIAFAQQMRANLTPETDLLLTVSNDAWFGRSHGPAQHNDLARLRAIELGRPLVRATNTGITSAYDAKGHELGRLPQFEEGILRVELPLVSGLTAYSRMGDWPALLLAGLALLAAFRWFKVPAVRG